MARCFVFMVILVVLMTRACADSMVLENDVIRGSQILMEFFNEAKNHDNGTIKDYYEYGRIRIDEEGDTMIDVEEVLYLSRYLMQQLLISGSLHVDCVNGFLVYRLGENEIYGFIKYGLEVTEDAYTIDFNAEERCEVWL